MKTASRINLLRRILLAKVVVAVAAWGLPALVGSAGFLAVFGITMPADPIFLRLFGVLAIALAVAYGYAYQDPVRNVAIIKVGVVDNGLATLTIIFLGLTVGVSSWFVWVSALLSAFFCAAFAVLMPRE